MASKNQKKGKKFASPSAKAEAVKVHSRRRYPWWFKGIACLLPILALVLLELILRIAGVGYPTGFFLLTTDAGVLGTARPTSGEKSFIENRRFGWRFFPPEMARTPQPLRIPVNKAKDVSRVVVLGESAAMGDPDAAFGFPRMLEVLLNERQLGRRFEVVNAAMTAINSHAIVEIAKDCQALKADYWVVYMGNNEVVGPYGAGTVFGPRAPSRFLVRAALAAKATKIGQFIDAALQSRKKDQSPGWGGMEMFLRQQCSASDPALQRTYQNFQKNLGAIISRAEKAGAKVILCTVAVNLKDCAPFASLYRKEIAPAQLQEWDKLYQEALRKQQEQQYETAENLFANTARLDDQFAELAFRRGQCALVLGKNDEARAFFQKSCDLDTLRFRADSRINQIIRETASARPKGKLDFVDIEKVLTTQSPQGLPGRDFFYEHVHFNPAGNYAVARAIAEQIAGQQKGWSSLQQVTYRLGLTDWNQYETARLMVQRLDRAPYTAQLNHQEQLRLASAELARLKPALQPAALRQAASHYRAVLARAANDWVLTENYARFLQQTGDLDKAAGEWRRLLAGMPHHAEAHCFLGLVLAEKAQTDEAQLELTEALRLNPNMADAYSGLGLCRVKKNQFAEALAVLKKALRLDPNLVNAHIYLADAYAGLGKKQEAQEELKLVLSLHPDHPAAATKLNQLRYDPKELSAALEFWNQQVLKSPGNAEAHFKLGNTLVVAGRFSEAVASFKTALELNPDLAEAHSALGKELMRQKQPEEALAQFGEAARLKPNEFQAHFDQGWALAELRRISEARDAFARAVQLKPNHKEARINLGVALRQLNEVDAAIAQFKEAARQYPDDPGIAQHLQQTQAQQRNR